MLILQCLGVSPEAIQLADATAYIPMSGFVSSFNVSVAAALVFYEARRARLERLGYHCDLTDHDKQVLTAVMLLRHQVNLLLLLLFLLLLLLCLLFLLLSLFKAGLALHGKAGLALHGKAGLALLVPGVS